MSTLCHGAVIERSGVQARCTAGVGVFSRCLLLLLFSSPVVLFVGIIQWWIVNIVHDEVLKGRVVGRGACMSGALSIFLSVSYLTTVSGHE